MALPAGIVNGAVNVPAAVLVLVPVLVDPVQVESMGPPPFVLSRNVTEPAMAVEVKGVVVRAVPVRVRMRTVATAARPIARERSRVVIVDPLGFVD